MKLSKTYIPNDYEPSIYALWETSGVFAAKGQGEPYSIVMPPPNANGNLHLGHALMAGIEDTLVRYYRMKGRDAVYLPGADHAGFETWVVYERQLEKSGKSRFDFTREQLYSQVWNFVEQQRGNMELQLRALGAGANWDNLTFTLDEKVINTVYETFHRLWKEGLIYRGERLVNYCTKHQTSFADIEVEYSNEKGTLWNIAYPTLDSIGEIVVATTRPETMLGDVAIAVHPDDERYKHLVGTRVVLPLTDREIPIIADKHVDPEYGTGAVKITPAHDPNDFEVGERHNLDPIQVIGFDGTMINVPAQFAGLSVDEARKKVLSSLELGEYMRGKKAIEHAVGHCYKCGTIIQPLIKDQWFVKVAPMVEKAKAAINNGEIKFYPASKKSALLQYYDNLHDWNISRQIPWGIPIPAFQNVNNPSDWIFDSRVDEPTIEVGGQTYQREEDTFDTWFSSAQWPFITTDVMTEGDLKRFYPNSVMETGHDILYQWVARMIMLGTYVTDQVPFKEVYLHGLVLDQQGQKMSKSKGNVVNPMEILSKYGSDALRMGLLSGRSAGQNQAYSDGKVVAARNFCNKLWNIARFIEGQIGNQNPAKQPVEAKTLADDWILSKIDQTINDLDTMIAQYRFSEATEAVYHLIWDDIADWYVETSKVSKNVPLLAYVLDTALRLSHPFAPFVTETIWQSLSWHNDILAASSWPEALPYSEIAAANFRRLQKLIIEARYVTAELPGNKRYKLLYQNDGLVDDNKEFIKSLARLEDIVEIDQPRGLRLASSGREAWLDVDSDTMYEHQSNLEMRLAEAIEYARKLEDRLANDSYVNNAPAKLVEESKQSLESQRELITRLQHQLDVISL